MGATPLTPGLLCLEEIPTHSPATSVLRTTRWHEESRAQAPWPWQQQAGLGRDQQPQQDSLLPPRFPSKVIPHGAQMEIL